MEKITMTEIINEVAEKTDVTKKCAKEIINCFLDEVKAAVVGLNTVQLTGLGTFNFADVEAKDKREGVINPRTGEKGMLPATQCHIKPKFAVSPKLKSDIKENTLGQIM